MRLSDLRGKRVRSIDGESLGRVHEVHCDGGRVVALMCGPASLVERWTAKSGGRRVPWNEVVRMERGTVVVANAETEKGS
jgi:sporulation protein YlmC with PRC-barrel domain